MEDNKSKQDHLLITKPVEEETEPWLLSHFYAKEAIHRKRYD
jgi:hypothetical protein